jgi:hypothetical protein
MAERVIGKTQYPKIQTLWKKEIEPPNSCALTVTIAAPHHTITNTAANTKEDELAGAVKLRVDERSKQTNNGPHKSPTKVKWANDLERVIVIVYILLIFVKYFDCCLFLMVIKQFLILTQLVGHLLTEEEMNDVIERSWYLQLFH